MASASCLSPQSQNSRARESKDSDSGKKNDVSSTVKEQHDNSDKVEGNQQDPVSISDTDEHQKTSPVACNDEEQAQWTKSIMVRNYFFSISNSFISKS